MGLLRMLTVNYVINYCSPHLQNLTSAIFVSCTIFIDNFYRSSPSLTAVVELDG